MAMDYAVAVNAEIRDLKAAGADVIQLDEPWLQARPEKAARYGLPAIDRALKGSPGPPRSISASAMPMSRATSRAAIPSCRSSPTARSGRSRSRRRSRMST